MIRSIIIGVLAIGIVATGIWGYNEQQQAQLLSIQAENNYQRAFHNLVYHVDQLEEDLGTVLAMNTRQTLSPKLADVWRVTSLAQSQLGELPLGLLPLSETEKFLYDVGRFSYKTAVRDLDKDPITDEEYELMEELYECSKEIQQELRRAQATLLQNDLRWLDIDMELAAAQGEPLDNAVINGFEIVNETVKGYSETQWGAGFSQMNVNESERLQERLNGPEISETEAKQKALDFIGVNGEVEVSTAETGNGLAYKAYNFTIDDPNHETHFYMGMTRKGGHPIWFLQDRQISEQNISLNEAGERAKEFLEQNGIDGMQIVDSAQYDSIGAFEFAYVQENVRVYADSIVVEVALDDGDVIAYEAMDYLINHHDERENIEPEITMEEAMERLNPRLEVMEDHIAIIRNEIGEEVLCYEFYGVLGEDTFRIFINAEDGEEEIVEKLQEPQPVYQIG
ncbi:germination protein YpeB [Alkalihalobacterium bogoriense]|uniref:germination protein YpeB n=1 Tax=Alkalihalobacterium bogoriense TaxID=246272 RepID=UPI0004793334|nr:germination protein YpeB [Alkalihalobacterium bogoriense]